SSWPSFAEWRATKDRAFSPAFIVMTIPIARCARVSAGYCWIWPRFRPIAPTMEGAHHGSQNILEECGPRRGAGGNGRVCHAGDLAARYSADASLRAAGRHRQFRSGLVYGEFGTQRCGPGLGYAVRRRREPAAAAPDGRSRRGVGGWPRLDVPAAAWPQVP